MPEIIATRGLPASGKSTWANEMMAMSENVVVVTKDDIRLEVVEGKWTPKKERKVVERQRALIKEAIREGNDVIVADTNLNPKTMASVEQLAKDLGAEFSIVEFDTPLDECIARDNARANGVGESVIRGMHNQFVRKVEVYEAPEGARPAIIVDVDGTLAKMGDRSPYDWKRVGIDEVISSTREIVRRFYKDHEVIIFSGRDGVCYPETYKWLIDNEIPFDQLHMRSEGDMRKDSIIKRELFDEHAANYDVRLVIDDRLQVTRMWFEMGLPVIRVGDPDANF